MMARIVGAMVLGLLMLVHTGCGYSLAGRGSFLPEYIRNIGVPQFTNATSVVDVDRLVSEQVRTELSGRGRYKVFPQEAGVDAVLSGQITSVTLSPVSFTNNQATRYVMTMSAQIEFKDVKTGKVLWSNQAMQFREEFEPTTGATVTDVAAYFGQDKDALNRIANEFARSVVSALLEAF
jgi:hypothetical protein